MALRAFETVAGRFALLDRDYCLGVAPFAGKLESVFLPSTAPEILLSTAPEFLLSTAPDGVLEDLKAPVVPVEAPEDVLLEFASVVGEGFVPGGVLFVDP